MHLFVALDLNHKVIANLTELMQRLAPMAPIRWVHPRNLHVTLKYIGQWDESRLEQVIDALSDVRVALSISVPLAGLGFFPNARNPRVFSVIAENTPPLRQLASGVDASLSPLGIAPEVRPYAPHLTLGRFPGDCDLTEMQEAIEELPSRDFGTIEPDHFVLFASQQTRNGPAYRRIEEFPFLKRVPRERELSLAARY